MEKSSSRKIAAAETVTGAEPSVAVAASKNNGRTKTIPSSSTSLLKLKNLTPTRLLARNRRNKSDIHKKQAGEKQQDISSSAASVRRILTGGGAENVTTTTTTTVTTTMPVSPFGKTESFQFLQEMKSTTELAAKTDSREMNSPQSRGGGSRTSTPSNRSQAREAESATTPTDRQDVLSPPINNRSTGFFVLDSAIDNAEKVLHQARYSMIDRRLEMEDFEVTLNESSSLMSSRPPALSSDPSSCLNGPHHLLTIDTSTADLAIQDDVVSHSGTITTRTTTVTENASPAIQSILEAKKSLEQYMENIQRSCEDQHDIDEPIATALKGLHQDMDQLIHSTLSHASSTSSTTSSPKIGTEGDTKRENTNSDLVMKEEAALVSASAIEKEDLKKNIGSMDSSKIATDHIVSQTQEVERSKSTTRRSQGGPTSVPTVSQRSTMELYSPVLAFLAMIIATKFFATIIQPPFETEVLIKQARNFVAAGSEDVYRKLSTGIHATKPLKGAVVVMTETVSGVGSSIAHGFSVLGATVTSLQVDCTDLNSVSKSVDSILDAFDRVDFLINTGNLCLWKTPTTNTTAPIPFISSPTSQGYDALFAGNYLSSFLMTQKVIPYLERSKFGTLVQLTSTASFFSDGFRHHIDGGSSGIVPLLSMPQTGGGYIGATSKLFQRFADVKLAEVLHIRTLKRIYSNIDVIEISKNPFAIGRDARSFFTVVFRTSKQVDMSVPKHSLVTWYAIPVISELLERLTKPRSDESLQDDFYDWSFDVVQEWIPVPLFTSTFFQQSLIDSKKSSSSSSGDSLSSSTAKDYQSRSIIPQSLKRYLEVGSTTMIVGGMSFLAWKVISATGLGTTSTAS